MTEDLTMDDVPGRLTDLARRGAQFRQRIAVAVGVMIVLLVLALASLYRLSASNGRIAEDVRAITVDTNEDQQRIIRPLQESNEALTESNQILAERNAELADALAESEDLQRQAVDHVERLALQVVELGGDPGIIRIEPTEEGD